jgi:hypothetical protein
MLFPFSYLERYWPSLSFVMNCFVSDEESAERLEPVGTQQSEQDDEIPVATQLDDGGLDLPTAVLRYLGSLPQSIGKDIELPLPQR